MSATVIPESLSPTARDFVEREHGLLIDGEFGAAADGRTFETLDPATGSPIASAAQAGAADVDRAVGAARRALEGKWGTMPAAQRGLLINRFADLVEQHGDELAEIESLDNGKPVTMAKAVDLTSTVGHLRYFAGWPEKIVGETIPVRQPDMLCYTRK